MLATVFIARCPAEIMEATAIPKIASLATILHILQLREVNTCNLRSDPVITSKGFTDIEVHTR